MPLVYYIFFALVAIVIAIIVGLNISSTIESTYFYILFWMMYILTIMTVFNIILSVQYYLQMRNKMGPVGMRGDSGDVGDVGEAGKCSSDCRDSIAFNSIIDTINKHLQQKSGNKLFKLRNVYIKQKIKQMCASNEFKQIAPYNGPNNLIKYLSQIWLLWCDEIINAGGGTRYFETIGAEQDWEWLKTNPFDEIKKYDVFYWGLGPEYRPQLIDKCYLSKDGKNVWSQGINDDGTIISTFKVAKTTYLDMLLDTTALGAKTKASFFRAKPVTYNTLTYYPVGDVIYAPINKQAYNSNAPYVGKMTMPVKSSEKTTPNIEAIVVAGDVRPPIDYRQIWSTATLTRKGNRVQFAVWRPIPPPGYVAMGDIITSDTATKPEAGESAPIRCVPASLVKIMKSPIGNSNLYWSTEGLRTLNNVYCIGVNRLGGTGKFRMSADSNFYNLFRTVHNSHIDIPNTDKTGSFYNFVADAYDPNDVPGANLGWPPTTQNKMIGRGYLASERGGDGSKYSIQGYLKLKTNMILTHQQTKTQVKLETANSEQANTYNLLVLNKNTNAYDICLAFTNKALGRQTCNKDDSSQFFKVEFTGNIEKQCRIIHRETGYFVAINANSNTFKIVKTIEDGTKNTTLDMTLFMAT